MANTQMVYFSFADRKTGKPVQSEGGRIYLFTLASRRDAGKSFHQPQPIAREYKAAGKSAPGRWQFLHNQQFLNAASEQSVPLQDPMNGEFQHLVFYSPTELGHAYLKAHWGEVVKRGSIISRAHMTRSNQHMTLAGRKHVVLLDASEAPLTAGGRCEIIKVELRDKKGDAESRQAGPNNVLTFVPEPVESIGLTLALPAKAKVQEKWKGRLEARNQWKEYKKHGSKLRLAKDGLFDTGSHEASTDWTINASVSYGGSKEAYFAAQCSKDGCKGAHAVKQLSPSPGGSVSKEGLKLAWKGADEWRQLKVAPHATRYTLQGAGCNGQPFTLLADVYPSTQISASVEFSRRIFDNRFKKLRGFLDRFGLGSGTGATYHNEMKANNGQKDLSGNRKPLEFNFAGSGKYLGCWAEEPNHWATYFNHAAALELSVTAGASGMFSLVQLGFGIPPKISDHLGDVRLTLGVTGQVAFTGQVVGKFQTPFGKHIRTDGSITGKVTVGLPITLQGYVGSPGTLGASINVATTPSLYGSAAAKYNQGWLVALSWGAPACSIDVTAQLDLVVKKKDWKVAKIDLWPDTPFGEAFFPLSEKAT